MIRRVVREFVVYGAIVLVTTVVVLEGLLEYSFRRPHAAPLPPHLVRYLYERFDRRVIQMLPECAQFDAVVTYTLRPGQCTFGNREFSNVYEINRLGLRDDEGALEGPEIIVLGDSLAMGWGVDGDEAFPSVIERLTGRRTLNAAVSSYGTARELLMLSRLDQSRLGTVVIQYSDNDTAENEAAIAAGTLRTLTRADYDASVARHASDTAYFPGKYALHTAIQIRNLLLKRPDRPQGDPATVLPAAARQASAFLGVLRGAPPVLSRTRVVVFAMNPDFIAEARRLAAGEDGWFREVHFVDLSHVLARPEWSYPLDGHQTAAGHEAIAEALLPFLEGQGR